MNFWTSVAAATIGVLLGLLQFWLFSEVVHPRVRRWLVGALARRICRKTGKHDIHDWSHSCRRCGAPVPEAR